MVYSAGDSCGGEVFVPYHRNVAAPIRAIAKDLRAGDHESCWRDAKVQDDWARIDVTKPALTRRDVKYEWQDSVALTSS